MTSPGNGLETLETLLAEAYKIRGTNLPESQRLATQALDEAARLNSQVHIGKAHNLLSLFNAIQCNFDLALDHASRALTLFSALRQNKGVADAYYNIASVYYRKDNFHLGLEYLLKSLRLYQDLNDHHNLARVYKSMGTVYEYFEDYSSAEASYINCIESSRMAGDKSAESNAYNPLSGLMLKKGLIDEAEGMVALSISLKNEQKDHRGLGFAIYARGKVSLARGKYEAALNDFKEALAIHEKFGDQLGQSMVHSKMSDAHLALQSFEEAKVSAIKALEISSACKIEFIRFKAYHRLYVINRELQNTAEALDNLERHMAIKEAVLKGQTLNIIKSYSAVSKIESLEKEARLQREKTAIIEQKNDELDSFFYRVSHDLKGPISSLLGLNNLAKMEISDAGSLQYFDLINSQTQRINNIVLGLIDLINLRNEAPKAKINFSELVDECVNSCFYLPNFSRVKVIKEIDANITFHSEWTIINTILQNLIENSIKYCRSNQNPFVKITIHQSSTFLFIVIEDNGEGIPKNLQSNMFNMFVRGSSRHNGSGLGLYILSRAIERLKGEIEVQSEVNQGSTFRIKIPFTTS